MSKYWSHLAQDLPAGFVVFLVAVPLCLGIALASGAPLFAGVIAGIVGGIVVGAISGSTLGVSGPAAGLTVVVLNAITELGSFELFLSAVVVAGLVQIILGIVRAGSVGYFVPNAVIKGMLAAIGAIIVLKQLPHAAGVDSDFEGDENFEQPDGQNTFTELLNMIDSQVYGALVITALSMLIFWIWALPLIKKNKVLKQVPAALMVVILGVLLNQFVLPLAGLTLGPEHLVSLPVAGNLGEFVAYFTLPDFSRVFSREVLIIGVSLAAIASLETLLSVEAVDKIDPDKNITPANRELVAQGVGNVVSGLLGGLPVTQVIVRSSANVQSGAKTKMSAIFHGILLLVAVATVPQWLNLVPYSSLAAVLLVIGYKLVNPAQWREILKKGPSQYVPFYTTVLAIVFTDLLVGIGIGLAVSLFFILYSNFRTPYRFVAKDYHSGDVIRFQLAEEVSFLNKGSFIQSFARIPNGATVIIDSSRTLTMDTDVEEIIQDFLESAQRRGITVSYVCDREAHHGETEFKKIIVEHRA